MKAFRFHLQPVLDFRETQEDRAVCSLREARDAENAEREQLESLHALRASVEGELHTLQRERLDPRESLCYLGYLARLDGRVDEQRQRLRARQQVSEERRQDLVRASLERRKLEKLKEDREAEHRTQMLALEERALDEVRTLRWGRAGRKWM